MEQESQQEAQKQNELPEGVQGKGPEPVEETANENEEIKDALKKYDAANFDQLAMKVSSDSIFAKAVLRDLLGLNKDDAPVVVAKTAGSPQEGNICGELDHSEFPPRIRNVGKGDTTDTLENQSTTDVTSEVGQ